MRPRITLIMTLAVLGGFAAILLMNMAALFGIIPSRYISPNDVRGIAVEHNQLLYTLNFDQQNAILDIFNRSIPVSKQEVEARKVQAVDPPRVSKIIIYRFNEPDIEITPIAYVAKSTSVIDSNHNLVFSAPLWNPKGYMEESASDEIEKLLKSTYDP